MKTEIAIWATRAPWEKDEKISELYKPQANFDTELFANTDDGDIALTLMVDRGDITERHEVTFWVSPESFDDLEKALRTLISYIDQERRRR